MARVCAVIPAAGRGSRLGIDVPKIMAPLGDGVLIWDALRELLAPHTAHLHVVMSPEGRPHLEGVLDRESGSSVSVSAQLVPTGMGDAVFGCSDVWEDYDDVLVVWGDQANLSHDTLAEVVRTQQAGVGRQVTIALVAHPDPYVEYLFDDGRLLEVRQSREGDRCTPGGLADVGVFCLTTAGLAAAWTRYRADATLSAETGEANLLPFLAHLSGAGWQVRSVEVSDVDEARGVNTPEDLAFARSSYARRTRAPDGTPSCTS